MSGILCTRISIPSFMVALLTLLICVMYVNAEGKEKTINADSVVVSAGRRPRLDEALEFYGSANRFFLIGDCRAPGNVHKCMRTAFATASQL